MNIQINCRENVEEEALRYIFHNLKFYINKYQESWESKTNRKWKYKTEGNWAMKRNIEINCNGTTMYFKIRE